VTVNCDDECELGSYPDLRVAEYLYKCFGCNVLCCTNLLTAELGRILIHFGQGHDSKYGEETIAATPKNGVNIVDRGFCKLERIKDLIQDKERYFVLRIKNESIKISTSFAKRAVGNR
jgi:hypothetical protein